MHKKANKSYRIDSRCGLCSWGQLPLSLNMMTK
uniref:Uncharacterized protein n=1 Tax=Anguilla anguilla TaxID=7936 RepID=A0A0E9Q1U7_ANGAN